MRVKYVLGRIAKLNVRNAEALRELRRELLEELRGEHRKQILELAGGLIEHGSSARLVAYELVKHGRSTRVLYRGADVAGGAAVK